MCFLENMLEYLPSMEKEGQINFERSFIQKSYLNRETGEWTADLDGRYGKERKGLPKATALEMLRLDDVVAMKGIKQGDQIDILVKVKEADSETGVLRTIQKWQRPFDGEKFVGVHEGKLTFSAPEGANHTYDIPASDVIHVRRHGAKNTIPHDSSKEMVGSKNLVELADAQGIKAGDSFQVYETVEFNNLLTGQRVQETGWRQTYGIEFRTVVGNQIVVDDNTTKANITRRLKREISGIRKAEALPYPFSDRKYLSQK